MKPVIVTTQHRGVFFGFLDEKADRHARSLELQNCRNVIYWSGKNGFLGLAATGPEEGSRIGSTASRVLLHDITSVTECTNGATKRFTEWKS